MRTQRQLVRRSLRTEPQGRGSLRTLTIMIPRNYNADDGRQRRRVELSKLVRTMREIRQLFSGYSVQPAEGWYRDKSTGKQYRDKHFRFDIDCFVTPPLSDALRTWKVVLQRRFDQQEIYMRLSGPAAWL